MSRAHEESKAHLRAVLSQVLGPKNKTRLRLKTSYVPIWTSIESIVMKQRSLSISSKQFEAHIDLLSPWKSQRLYCIEVYLPSSSNCTHAYSAPLYMYGTFSRQCLCFGGGTPLYKYLPQQPRRKSAGLVPLAQAQ